MNKKVSTFSKRLKKILDYKDIKQSELARQLKVDRSTITKYINGENTTTTSRLDEIANLFDVSPAWLLGYDVPMERGALLKEDTNTIKVPLFASIPQNKGDAIRYIDLPKERVNGQSADYFLYKVSGDDMAPKYLDGDIVLFKYNNMPKNNTDVLININDKETVFSKINIEENSIKLNKYNPFYDDVTYTKDEMKKLNIKIIAEVQSLEYRDLRG